MSKIDILTYPAPILAKIWGVSFGVDPSFWGLPRVKCTVNANYVAAKATYIRLLHGKIGFLGFFSASSVKWGRTHIVLV